jgi:hypothetical protein
MELIKSPTSKTGRYLRWMHIGWRPIPFKGSDVPPDQARFRLKLTVVRQRGVEVDAWAETGESMSSSSVALPHMEVALHVIYDDEQAPQCYFEVAGVLHQTVRHELEHLMDEGFLAVSGPIPPRPRSRIVNQERWQRSVRLTHWSILRRKLFARGKMTRRKWKALEVRLTASASRPNGRILDYIISPRELHAFVKGFQSEARYRGVSWDIPMCEYVDSMRFSGKMTGEEADAAKAMLTQWAVAVIPHAPISEETIVRYL